MRTLSVISVLLLLAGCPTEDIALDGVRFSPEPAALDVSALFIGQTADLFAGARGDDGSRPALSSAAVLDAAGPALATVELEGNTAKVRVTAGQSVGLFTATLRVEIGATQLDIPLSASVRPWPDCDDADPCTQDRFENGACIHQALADGSACDDGNSCTDDDVCVAGQCLGEMVMCDDGVECTVDRCDRDLGCVSDANDAACDDGDPCTSDVCLADAGCEITPKQEGDLCASDLSCGELGFCMAGACVMSPVPDGFPCDDGNVCTDNDTCQAGACVSGSTGSPASAQVLLEGSFLAQMCTGPLLDNSPDKVCIGDRYVEPEAVLDARWGEGGYEVIWRSRFEDQAGVPCDPVSFYLPTVPPNGEGEPQPPPPPQDPLSYCGAAVFHTQFGVPGIVEPRFLTAAFGPVVASFLRVENVLSGFGDADGVADRDVPEEAPGALPQPDLVIAQTRADLSSVALEGFMVGSSFPLLSRVYAPNIATDIGGFGTLSMDYTDYGVAVAGLEASYCMWSGAVESTCDPRVGVFTAYSLEPSQPDGYQEIPLHEPFGGCTVPGQRLIQPRLELSSAGGQATVLASLGDPCSALDPFNGFGPTRIHYIRPNQGQVTTHVDGFQDAVLDPQGVLVDADLVCPAADTLFCVGCDDEIPCQSGPLVRFDFNSISPAGPLPDLPGRLLPIPDLASYAVMSPDGVHLETGGGALMSFAVPEQGFRIWTQDSRGVAVGAAAVSVLEPDHALFDGDQDGLIDDGQGNLVAQVEAISAIAVQPFACLELSP